MIAALLMTWCLAGQCEEIRAPVQLSMMECVIHGQQVAAWWISENPAYAQHKLRRWRCETGERT